MSSFSAISSSCSTLFTFLVTLLVYDNNSRPTVAAVTGSSQTLPATLKLSLSLSIFFPLLVALFFYNDNVTGQQSAGPVRARPNVCDCTPRK